ncbi:helix-turn-helix domain-containing protein [Streptococcus rifensis]
MYKRQIGQLVKSERLKQQLTQTELAEGICTQTVISNIEKGQVSPSIEIFFALVKKLHIDLNEVGKIFSINPKFSEGQFISKCKQLQYSRDYDTLSYLLNSIDESKLAYEEKLYYDWLSAVLVYTNKKEPHKAIELLRKLSEDCPDDLVIYFKSICSIGTIYNDIGEHGRSITEFEHVNHLYPEITNFEDQVVYLYSYARVLGVSGNYSKSMELADLSIGLLIKNKSLFLLADIYYLKANIFNQKGDILQAKEFCQKAILCYDIDNNIELKYSATRFLDELKEKV